MSRWRALLVGLFLLLCAVNVSWSQGQGSPGTAKPATTTSPCGRYQIVSGEHDFGTAAIHTTIMVDTESGRTWQLRTLWGDASKKNVVTGWEPLGEVHPVPLEDGRTPQP